MLPVVCRLMLSAFWDCHNAACIATASPNLRLCGICRSWRHVHCAFGLLRTKINCGQAPPLQADNTRLIYVVSVLTLLTFCSDVDRVLVSPGAKQGFKEGDMR
jgi:hypothetical protein